MSKVKSILKNLFRKKEENLQDLIQPWGEACGTFVDCKPGDPSKVDFLDLNSITEVRTGEYSQDIPPHTSPTGGWMRKGETHKVVSGDHVIVDRIEWDEVIEYLLKNGNL